MCQVFLLGSIRDVQVIAWTWCACVRTFITKSNILTLLRRQSFLNCKLVLQWNNFLKTKITKYVTMSSIYHGFNSSLHNIIRNSFRVVLVLWRLLTKLSIFLSYVIVVPKSSCGDWIWLLLEKKEKKIFFLLLLLLF